MFLPLHGAVGKFQLSLWADTHGIPKHASRQQATCIAAITAFETRASTGRSPHRHVPDMEVLMRLFPRVITSRSSRISFYEQASRGYASAPGAAQVRTGQQFSVVFSQVLQQPKALLSLYCSTFGCWETLKDIRILSQASALLDSAILSKVTAPAQLMCALNCRTQTILRMVLLE